MKDLEKFVFSKNNKIRTNSKIIAEQFEKEHYSILRDIKNLECSEEFNLINFDYVEYIDPQGKPRPMYEITRDGFMFLVMGFNGKKAAQIKEKFIEAFNLMEKKLLEIKDQNSEQLEIMKETIFCVKNNQDLISENKSDIDRLKIYTEALDERMGTLEKSVHYIKNPKIDPELVITKCLHFKPQTIKKIEVIARKKDLDPIDFCNSIISKFIDEELNLTPDYRIKRVYNKSSKYTKDNKTRRYPISLTRERWAKLLTVIRRYDKISLGEKVDSIVSKNLGKNIIEIVKD